MTIESGKQNRLSDNNDTLTQACETLLTPGLHIPERIIFTVGLFQYGIIKPIAGVIRRSKPPRSENSKP